MFPFSNAAVERAFSQMNILKSKQLNARCKTRWKAWCIFARTCTGMEFFAISANRGHVFAPNLTYDTDRDYVDAALEVPEDF